VARKVWQPIAVSIPASEARRRTMRQASSRRIGLSDNCPVFPIAERNNGPLRLPSMPAALVIEGSWGYPRLIAVLKFFSFFQKLSGASQSECFGIDLSISTDRKSLAAVFDKSNDDRRNSGNEKGDELWHPLR
jgi:hypothetical protein